MDGHFTFHWTTEKYNFLAGKMIIMIRMKWISLVTHVIFKTLSPEQLGLLRIGVLTTSRYFSVSASNMLMSFSNNENFTFPWWMIYHGAARGPDWLVKSPVGTNNYQATVSPHLTWHHTEGPHHHTWHHMTSYDITWQQRNLHVSWRHCLHFGL